MSQEDESSLDVAYGFAILMSKMSRVKPQAIEGLVTSDAVIAGSLLRKRLRVALIALAIAALLGTSSWYGLTQTSWFRSTTVKKIDYSKLSPTQALQQAKTDVQSATSSPEKAAAYSNLGNAYVNNNDTSNAITAYRAALVYSPEDIQLLEELSSQYEDAGDTANAVKELQKVIAALNASTISDKSFLLSRYQAELQYYQGKQ